MRYIDDRYSKGWVYEATWGGSEDRPVGDAGRVADPLPCCGCEWHNGAEFGPCVCPCHATARIFDPTYTVIAETTRPEEEK